MASSRLDLLQPFPPGAVGTAYHTKSWVPLYLAGVRGRTITIREQPLAGIITDRDVAIRATAEGADPKTTKVEGIYTHDVTALAPTDTVHDAVQLMRARNVRRLPVVERGKAIGIVSLGDISVETTPSSVLADISTASPDR